MTNILFLLINFYYFQVIDLNAIYVYFSFLDNVKIQWNKLETVKSL